MALTVVDGGMLSATNAQYTGFKNRIINGAMVIDQRNVGASVTANNSYTVDRWAAFNTQASKYTVQRNAGSVTPPTGFINYLGITSSSAYSVLTGDYFFINQAIEGLNIADLAWGTANAATVTLSFQVRSSLTGTFGGALKNGGSTRSYPFTYTISSANTWTTISIIIAGDTSGTWATDNTSGINVQFGLGAGSTYSGTAGSWSTNNYVTATGATSVVGTNGATFYITGVQLEKGSTATSFDYRPYTTELQLCQRYYQMSYPQGVAPGTASYIGCALPATTAVAASTAGNSGTGYLGFKVSMRTAPTVTLYTYDGTINSIIKNSATNRTGVTAVAGAGLAEGFVQYITFNSSSATAIAATDILSCSWTASAEL